MQCGVGVLKLFYGWKHNVWYIFLITTHIFGSWLKGDEKVYIEVFPNLLSHLHKPSCTHTLDLWKCYLEVLICTYFLSNTIRSVWLKKLASQILAGYKMDVNGSPLNNIFINPVCACFKELYKIWSFKKLYKIWSFLTIVWTYIWAVLKLAGAYLL